MTRRDEQATASPEQLAVADRLDRRLVDAPDGQAILAALLAELSPVVPLVPAAGMVRVDQARNIAVTLASTGACSACDRCAETIRIGDCLCGYAVVTGTLVYSLSSRTDPRHTRATAGSPPHGHVVVPVRSGDAVTYLTVYYLPEDCVLDRSQLALLAHAAKAAALAAGRLDILADLSSEATPLPAAAAPRTRMIAVADDQTALRNLMVKILRVLGCEACGFPDAASLASSLDSCTPDAVLLDWNLAEGKASAVLAELRRRAIPVVVVTGDPCSVGDVGVPVLGKPFDCRQLSAILDEV
jgi:hypothetical protein